MSKLQKSAWLLGAIGTLICAPFASAAIIYNNGGPDQSGFADEMTQSQLAEEFTIGSTATITDVRFWALLESSSPGPAAAPLQYNGSISWAIYTSGGGATCDPLNPGASPCPVGLLASGNQAGASLVQTGQTVLSTNDEFQIDFTLNTPFVATGGVTYFLSLHNGPLADTTNANFLWETTSSTDAATGRFFTLNGGTTWQDTGFEHAFLLESNASSVPEPSAMFLFGGGLAGLAAFRRRLFSR
jgi:hypothetical protein